MGFVIPLALRGHFKYLFKTKWGATKSSPDAVKQTIECILYWKNIV